ncbi:mitochondrial protein Pet127-domain-containing protein [Rhypophila decipiens]|uniref:Mitochondrial protein Pet127-domain-containing protein n=1 Tax=Rhypophila decipiens TaxID=261697 RepID=A0AAN6YI02_9PEZI|nr:mitochondrial protein Pet127-domain-containing protein [Rhypophila decipiens]
MEKKIKKKTRSRKEKTEGEAEVEIEGDNENKTTVGNKDKTSFGIRRTVGSREAPSFRVRKIKLRDTQLLAPDKMDRRFKVRLRRLKARKRLINDPSILDADEYKLKAVGGGDQPPVARLAHGLDRVLFNPGVYHLQDPRSRVYNFDPYLSRIIPVKEFDFDALKKYITSSEDTKLIEMAATHKREYTGSTSSMTSILSHFHFLLSMLRPVDALTTSRHFEVVSNKFTRSSTAPIAAFLHYKDGVYAIDADKEFDNATVLMLLGHSMEKLLTVPKEEFQKYHKAHSSQLTEEERNTPEPYHYSLLGKFLMRSQIDAYDPRLPGTGTFDLKTRAVAPIRLSSRDMKRGLGYEIRNRFGQWESYEREYHDLTRSGFLKYSLQVRIGRMDGCFVAYHNTERIFGFQYVPLSEMDQALHGTPNPDVGDREFNLSIGLLEKALDKATQRFPKRSLRLHFETRPTSTAPVMYIFAEPVTAEQIKKVQEKSRKKVDDLEQEVLEVEQELDKAHDNLPTIDGDAAQESGVTGQPTRGGELNVVAKPFAGEEACKAIWVEIQEKIKTANFLKDDKTGREIVRTCIKSALLESGIIDSSDPDLFPRYIEALFDAVAPKEWSEASALDSLTAPESVPEAGKISLKDRLLGFASGVIPSLRESAPPAVEAALLKDLFLQLASSVKTDRNLTQPPQESSAAQAAEDSVSQDILNLRKFMAILSTLANKTDPSSAAVEKAVEEPVEKAVEEPVEEDEESPPTELLGILLKVENIVNGKPVTRPSGNKPIQDWRVEYELEEITDHQRAHRLYAQLRERRRKAFARTEEPPPSADSPASSRNKYKYDKQFGALLQKWANKGKAWREDEHKAFESLPVQVVDSQAPLTWKSVFGPEAVKKPELPYQTVEMPNETGKWEDSTRREELATLLRARDVHLPQFDASSSFYEHDSGKILPQLRASLAMNKKLEKRVSQLRTALAQQERRKAAQEQKRTFYKDGIAAQGDMLGLSLNELPAEEEEEEEGILTEKNKEEEEGILTEKNKEEGIITKKGKEEEILTKKGKEEGGILPEKGKEEEEILTEKKEEEELGSKKPPLNRRERRRLKRLLAGGSWWGDGAR